ncbi:rIIB-like protein [Pectobacterium phage vB_PatP_CB1]|uniref:RIIB-like protein n=1 Tax=Pectobacterium phage vB_PatP_CB1 TaxID=1958917 RepID=A0A2P0PB55_9CAUD|nr:RIIB lysis inhibitor [Pectobacterium phage vB_PatP_CB1]ARB11772.1 rIIB-like protein [Pectobacterium phage vB_PatP_CB1]
MKNSVVVVAVSVDASYVILFTDDGNTVDLKQGDPRITNIMATVKAPLSEVPPRAVEVSLEMPKATLDTPEFGAAEEVSGGVIRFFKVAKKRIADWFKDEPESPPAVADPAPSAFVAPQILGVVPGTEVQSAELEAPVKPAAPTNEEKLALANARLDILEAEGVKPSDPKFKEELTEDETVVAVTSNGRTIIPEAQHLATQLKAATELKDFTGFQKFLDRLGTVVNKRRFSVEDLMKFMKHGDLPIADDGSLVIYKRLTKHGKDKSGRDLYVDVHSRKVIQRVGSRVFMDESLVDPDRRQDCSNGLHVAALSYLRGFSGAITIIGKVAPEDVIAVPEYSNNKMRVAGYDILAVLDGKQASVVNSGGKLSSVPGGTELLNAVLRGKHIPIDQTVQIGGAKGSNLTITDLENVSPLTEVLKPEDIRNKNLDVPDKGGYIPPKPSEPVKPVDLKPEEKAPANKAENLTPVEPKVENVKKETKAQTAQRLYDEFKGAATSSTAGTKAAELLAFKKSSKKSWTALGLSDDIGGLVTEKATSVAPKVAVKTVSGFDDLKAKAPKAGSPKAQMAEVLKGSKINVEIANKALAIKRAAKKSWATLGVSDEVAAMIESLTK